MAARPLSTNLDQHSCDLMPYTTNPPMLPSLSLDLVIVSCASPGSTTRNLQSTWSSDSLKLSASYTDKSFNNTAEEKPRTTYGHYAQLNRVLEGYLRTIRRPRNTHLSGKRELSCISSAKTAMLRRLKDLVNGQHRIGRCSIVLSVSGYPHGMNLESMQGSSRMIGRRQPRGQLLMISNWTNE
ncbi:hypothetical protein AC579_4450 [Pseudocercospora musae]|uniref:Uncharacterized protein n=1 Tax=Pseudocercospora musae TaxID=113226 RepID=A0A139H8R0_9PEZI|nr:hypothetical protein AC579_4450 [Pseudocercospora musae]